LPMMPAITMVSHTAGSLSSVTGPCFMEFKELGILTMTSLYVLEVLCYVRKYCRSISENSTIYNHNTRRKIDLHIQSCRAASFQKV
jgi:hypothetical protein